MKQFSTLLLIMFSFQGFSQDEVEWFQPGQEWYYDVYCFQDYACGYTHYEVGGTEDIGGEEATVLNRTYSDEIVEEPVVSQEYFRFVDDTVWRFSTIAEEWHMLWDVGAAVGDVWTIQEDVFYGYSFDGTEPETIPLFKVVVDEVTFWDDVPNSLLTNRWVINTLPVNDENGESQFAFGPILEGVGAIGGAHDLIGNPSITLLPFQSPSFQCFLDNGSLAYGEAGSPCFTLGTEEIEEVESGLIYPNPAQSVIFWDEPIDELKVFDSLGKLVLQSNKLRSTSSISVAELLTGFYTVVIKSENKTFTQKLLINR